MVLSMKSGSNLERVLLAGHFAFTGELGPPRGSNAEEVRHKASFLKGNVDSVNITIHGRGGHGARGPNTRGRAPATRIPAHRRYRHPLLPA